jgi:menaquinol-cytochrome c reductase iron-sulfur subunit
MAKSPHVSRNEFVKVVVGALGSVIGAVVGLPAIGYLLSPAVSAATSDSEISLGKLDSFEVGVPVLRTFTSTKVNGWERTVNSYGVFVLKKSDTEFEVISNICTHLACRVTWLSDKQEYVCPCHDGRFSINGVVNSGPAPRALDKYDPIIDQANGILKINFKKG